MVYALETPTEGIPIVTPGGTSSTQQQSHQHHQVRGLSLVRPSSVVLIRLNGNVVGLSNDEKPSWYEPQDDATIHWRLLSCSDRLRLLFDCLLVLLVPILISLIAFYASNRVLAFVFALMMALATYEYVWLAYQVRLRVFLPFKLHQKQTDRDLYAQIMSYSVDLHTTAVTSIAERLCCGQNMVAASMLSVLVASITLGVSFLIQSNSVLQAYLVMVTFIGMVVACMSPNLPDAIAVLLRFAYYCIASINVLMVSSPLIDSYSLLLCSISLSLILRVLTSKEAMESTVMVLLDVSGILYLSCTGAMLNSFCRAMVEASDSGRPHALVGFFAIVWSSELGGCLVSHGLQALQPSRWQHPLAKHVSSHQTIEKLIGSLLFGIGAVFLSAQCVQFYMETYAVAILATTSIVFAQIGKLLLLSLKKIAQVNHTGEYLRLGGGMLDRMDTLLLMAVVFCPFFERPVFD